jgi:hypothetical protein
MSSLRDLFGGPGFGTLSEERLKAILCRRVATAMRLALWRRIYFAKAVCVLFLGGYGG